MSARTAGAIQVGPNVRLSTDGRRPHYEVHLTADPQDPRRLAACVTVGRQPGYSIVEGIGVNNVLYVSNDGGRAWTRAVEDSSTVMRMINGWSHRMGSWDPTCEYGSAGQLYFASPTYVAEGPRQKVVRLHRSFDGGRTWLAPTLVIDPPLNDRSWLTVDTRPESPFAGQVYLAYYAERPENSKLAVGTVVASTDLGASFRPLGLFPDNARPGPYGGVTLSDGTLVLTSSKGVAVLVGNAGSQRFMSSTILATDPGSSQQTLAVDRSAGPFRDRLYLAWTHRLGNRHQVVMAYSADQGRTWSVPRILNDDTPQAQVPGRLEHHWLPTLAVNRDGVVGVSWYRYTDIEADGHYVRFRASLDGGETWLPSVLVSERPQAPFELLDVREGEALPLWPQGRGLERDSTSGALRTTLTWAAFGRIGDYAGLTATTDGVFHAGWIDNRTGVPQVWTAPIRVRGRAGQDGALAGLHDLTDRVSVTLEAVTFRKTGRTAGHLVGSVAVTNRSADTLCAPLRLRVRELLQTQDGIVAERPQRLTLEGGHPYWRSAEVWDLSAGLSDGVLPPGATTAPVPIRFAVTRLTLRGGFPLQVWLFASGEPHAAPCSP